MNVVFQIEFRGLVILQAVTESKENCKLYSILLLRRSRKKSRPTFVYIYTQVFFTDEPPCRVQAYIKR